jgi:hypothetical protein
VIIVAGMLRVAAADRDSYLDAVAHVAGLARLAPLCLDFVQAGEVRRYRVASSRSRDTVGLRPTPQHGDPPERTVAGCRPPLR